MMNLSYPKYAESYPKLPLFLKITFDYQVFTKKGNFLGYFNINITVCQDIWVCSYLFIIYIYIMY